MLNLNYLDIKKQLVEIERRYYIDADREEEKKKEKIYRDEFDYIMDLIEERIKKEKEEKEREEREHEINFDHHFDYKKDHIQFFFPYIIEHNEMQSKFPTTRYYNTINLVVPYLFDFYNINEVKKELYIYYNSFIQNENQIEKAISIPKKLNQCFQNPFYLYQFYYELLQTQLKQNHLRKNKETKRKSKELDKQIVESYDDFNYYKCPTYLWTLIFQDPLIEKFINLFIKDGKKELIERTFMKAFLHLTFYMRLNPFVILKKAIENVRPFIQSKNIPFGRRTKTVPHPIMEKLQFKLAMRWVKEEITNNKDHRPLHFKIVDALLNACNKKGYAYNKMLSTHSEAYAQRAYMYSNYYLKSSKAKNIRKF